MICPKETSILCWIGANTMFANTSHRVAMNRQRKKHSMALSIWAKNIFRTTTTDESTMWLTICLTIGTTFLPRSWQNGSSIWLEGVDCQILLQEKVRISYGFYFCNLTLLFSVLQWKILIPRRNVDLSGQQICNWPLLFDSACFLLLPCQRISLVEKISRDVWLLLDNLLWKIT